MADVGMFFVPFEHKNFEINAYDAIALKNALEAAISKVDDFLAASEDNRKTAEILGIGPDNMVYKIQKELLQRLTEGHFEAYAFRK